MLLPTALLSTLQSCPKIRANIHEEISHYQHFLKMTKEIHQFSFKVHAIFSQKPLIFDQVRKNFSVFPDTSESKVSISYKYILHFASIQSSHYMYSVCPWFLAC